MDLVTGATGHIRYVLLQSNCAISHAKASRDLGFNPHRLRVSLEDTITWLRRNRRGVSALS